MFLPDSVEPYRSKGEEYLKNKGIVECTFSGPTYQIGVRDKKGETYWIFLQLSGNEVKDIFCSCENSEEGACEHMAAACLYVFSYGKGAIHTQFEGSFWRKLFFTIFLETDKKLTDTSFSFRNSPSPDFSSILSITIASFSD